MANNNNCKPIIKRTVIDITDPEYFCNKSWSLSYNFNTNSWISFHSYIPNWYIAENNFFYSGLNGGCDLEALAIEEVPYPSTSTTTICVGCNPPEPTTSTTTTIKDCNLNGFITLRDCDLDGTAVNITPTTTTTSSSSTTSTTTTICPTCNTYLATNSTEERKVISATSCYTNEVILFVVNANSSAVFCACSLDDVPVGVTTSIIASGCQTCFCYTIVNNTGRLTPIQYVTCDFTEVQYNMDVDEVLQVCAQFETVTSFFPVQITGGTVSCIVDGDCTTTTTTTSI